MSKLTIKQELQVLDDIIRLLTRNKRAGSTGLFAEPYSEREFVRLFGAKARSVRYGNRIDFVGLRVCGNRRGFRVDLVEGERRLVQLARMDTGSSTGWFSTGKFLVLKDNDSVSNLYRGLLRWVW